MRSWTIRKVEKNPFNKSQPTDPDALYTVMVSETGSDWCAGSGYRYKDLEIVMDALASQIRMSRQPLVPESLVGRIFGISCAFDDPLEALDYLIIEQKNGGEYTPPTAEELYEMAAQAISRMKLPDFSLIDKKTIYNAFAAKWDDPKWLQWFAQRINVLSGGKVKLVESDAERFSSKIRGPAKYLELDSSEKKQRITLGPYATPISFD